MAMYPAMSIEEVVLCTDMAAIFSNHGIAISLPWDGHLDDLERERFIALLTAMRCARSRHPDASIGGGS